MITFIYTLLGSVIAAIAFLSYQHPKQGQKISAIGSWVCAAIFIIVSVFYVGYNYGLLQYFKFDKNNLNFDKASSLIYDDIATVKIVVVITGVCFFILNILSMTTFKEINNNIDNTKNTKTE